MEQVIFTPSDFVAVFNQTVEYAYPLVIIEGELTNFRVSKNRWVYFDLKDETASLRFFGSVYNLPGPLQDGLSVRVIGKPHLHPLYNFSINFESIAAVGEGSIKKAADLLFKKLEAEGLFASERKRLLPAAPASVGLITAGNSAAYADFIKILNERWSGVDVYFYDVYVQGEQSPVQIVEAVEYFNRLAVTPEVLVVTRGGGSAEDLASFNDERVVRAVAASRVPTLIAVGHEVDISLAELAADQRASTPSNAAQLLTPDREHVIRVLQNSRKELERTVIARFEAEIELVEQMAEILRDSLKVLLADGLNRLESNRKLISVFDPYAALRRGYAIISKGIEHINSIKQVKSGDRLDIQLSDGKIGAIAE